MAALLSAAPVAANGGSHAEVLSNGTLLITGDSTDNRVAGCQTDATTWEIAHVELDGTTLTSLEEFTGVTTDVKFDMRAGADLVILDCLLFDEEFGAGLASPTAPRDIIVLGGSGNDEVQISGVNVDDDVNVQLGSGFSDSLLIDYLHVGDDLLIRGQDGFDDVSIVDAWVEDRTDINGGADSLNLNIFELSTGRTQVNASGGLFMFIDESDLGSGPRIVSGNASDFMNMSDVAASGRMFVYSGSGDDEVNLSRTGPPYSLTANLAAGNDFSDLLSGFGPGDLVNCGSGEDTLAAVGAGSIINCEIVP